MSTKSPQTGPKRIGDAAAELGLETHVLRYWETEFTQLTPIRTRSGQRLYDHSHMTLLRHIQDLLHTQGMTIEGARRMLNALLNTTKQHKQADYTPHAQAQTYRHNAQAYNQDINKESIKNNALRTTLKDIQGELLRLQGLLNPARLQHTPRDPS